MILPGFIFGVPPKISSSDSHRICSSILVRISFVVSPGISYIVLLGFLRDLLLELPQEIISVVPINVFF